MELRDVKGIVAEGVASGAQQRLLMKRAKGNHVSTEHESRERFLAAARSVSKEILAGFKHIEEMGRAYLHLKEILEPNKPYEIQLYDNIHGVNTEVFARVIVEGAQNRMRVQFRPDPQQEWEPEEIVEPSAAARIIRRAAEVAALWDCIPGKG